MMRSVIMKERIREKEKKRKKDVDVGLNPTKGN